MSDDPNPTPAPEPAPTPAPEPDPTPAPQITPDNWRDTLPEDIRESASLSKFTTLEGLAKSYVSLEGKLGTERIPIPKTDEDWANWYKAAGRPDDAKGYEFAKPEKLPEGLEYSEDQDNRFREIAHKHGLNQSQAQALRQEFLEFMGSGAADQTAQAEVARAEGEAALKIEWGNAYPQKLAEANAAMKKYAGDDFAAWAEETGAGNDPRLIQAFARIADATMGESELVGRGEQEHTPADLDAAISTFRGAHHEALNDARHPEHKTRVAELQRLYEKRHPEQAA